MDTSLRDTLAPWGNYYLITGGAAGGLTGLQFVVQSLLSSETFQFVTEGDPVTSVAAFNSPTVVHLSAALVISATACAPWSSSASLRLVLVALGLVALVYCVIVLGRARRQRAYRTTAYDWLWYVAMPAVAYFIFTVAAALFDRSRDLALDGMAIATLMLVCIGIHNAWDTVVYLTIATVSRRKRDAGTPAQHESATN